MQSLPLSPSITADSRRALWLPEHKLLAVADLHLGYVWAHRSRGQLLPVSREEDTVERLLELQEDYQPERVVILGDIVHGTVSLPEVRTELDRLINELSQRSQLTLLLGNHDHLLERNLTSLPTSVSVQRKLQVGKFLLLHGDDSRAVDGTDESLTLIMGHEHPTLSLGDGVTSEARCPCFLFSDRAVVLPAFSYWANGCTVGKQPFLSPLLEGISFTHACAIFGQRILRVPL
ncbi:MAG TPA: metallophosphoesterase [Verrucomicrobiae bacterium]